MPYEGGTFQIDLDFIDHCVNVSTSDGRTATMPLQSQSVADFYAHVFQILSSLDIGVSIHGKPNEMPAAIPFREDRQPRLYDPIQMNLLWQAMTRAEVVFTTFRSCFRGKVSPVHLFWGGFDLAVTRFSGRSAPPYPGGIPNIPNRIMQEAYSHEVSSCGFWPGSEESPMPLFYSYCYPTPAPFGKQPVEPAQAFYNEQMGEFILPYEAVRAATEPDDTLLQFLRTTYEAAAVTGNWDRALECDLTSYKI
jgi:hypothetical protein